VGWGSFWKKRTHPEYTVEAAGLEQQNEDAFDLGPLVAAVDVLFQIATVIPSTELVQR
jgi:hypothetical protein